jgi:hypothetical protein
MRSNDKAGLKQAFAHMRKPDEDQEAERKLLGRIIEPAQAEANGPPEDRMSAGGSYQVATSKAPERYQDQSSALSGLTPRPLLQREPERQLSFRCPLSLVAELQRKARFNQLEQQQILKEGLKRVLAELSDPPEGWVG